MSYGVRRFMFIVGIDVAKKFHQAVITASDGSLVGKPFKFDNTSSGFKILLDKITAACSDLSQFEFGMEATGHYWLNLYTWLVDRKFAIHVINPIQSNALRNLYIRKTKNDSIDAKLIADVIRTGKYSETPLSDDKIISLRDLCRQRFYLIDMASDLKRKIIAMMDRVFPEYEDFFTDMFGKSSVEVLKECTTPEEIMAIDTQKLTDLLRKSSKGRFKEQKAKDLKELASNSFGALLASDTLSLLIKQMLEQIELLEKQVSDLDKIIAKNFESFDTKLTQIPGIGSVLGAVIFSEIGDINRFDNPKKLTAFAGIDPSVYQSGNFISSESHMSKRGSPYLRHALWLAATVAEFHDDALHYLYQKKRDSGKSHMQATGFICHKLLNIVYTVLKNNIDYVPVFPPDVDVSELVDKCLN